MLTFDSDIGQRVQLDPADLPVTADLRDPDLRHRLWEHQGPWVGWVLLPLPVRSWRRLCREHDCDATPARHKPRRTGPVTPAAPPPAPPLLHPREESSCD